jgi:uncharacterized protein YcbX/ribosome-associated protein YbcJ (S4-like RNA binding protein)
VRVVELWRYPVKSLQGERLATAAIGTDGVVGDRQWALVDPHTGDALTARRDPDLLFATGRLRADGGVEVVLPDGTVTADDGVLSDWLGRRVQLRRADGAGPFHDDPDARLSLVSTGTLGDWDPRRFRSNVVLDGAGEDGLVGAQVRLGSAFVAVVEPIPRCVMVTRPQAGGIGRDTSVLKTVHRERGGDLAVGAQVLAAGTVRTGDVLTPARRDTGPVRTIDLRPGEDSIRLGQLLKLVDAVPSGAQVKDVLLSGVVLVNGEPEERRGRQLRRGDVVSVEGGEDVRIG